MLICVLHIRAVDVDVHGHGRRVCKKKKKNIHSAFSDFNNALLMSKVSVRPNLAAFIFRLLNRHFLNASLSYRKAGRVENTRVFCLSLGLQTQQTVTKLGTVLGRLRNKKTKQNRR